jgi:hypothetical protein
MIISPGRRYVFVHIPKTGGTALTLALESRALPDDILIGDTPLARARRRQQAGLRPAGRLWKHSTLADIDGVVTSDDLDRFLIVTLVRNPWDRMVSYYHWLRAQSFAHPAVARAKALDFAGFIRDPATGRAQRLNPVARYLTDAAGVERPALICRIEHLVQDWGPLVAHLGFVPDLPRVNASDRPRDWRPFYGNAEADLVADFCAADIARFGYRFDP